MICNQILKVGMTWELKLKGKDILVGNNGMGGHTEVEKQIIFIEWWEDQFCWKQGRMWGSSEEKTEKATAVRLWLVVLLENIPFP